MSKERLMNGTTVDLYRIPTDQLITLLGEAALRVLMAQDDEVKIVEAVGVRIREINCECGDERMYDIDPDGEEVEL